MTDPLVTALRLRREQLGWAPMKLARKLGWSPSHVHRFEVAEEPKLPTVRRVAEALGCDLILSVRSEGNTQP